MEITEHDKILEAIKDMKKDLIDRFDNSIKALKDITHKDIAHIGVDIASLKDQSKEHYAEQKTLRAIIGETVVEHAQEDVRHIEEVDVKIDQIGNRMTNLEHTLSRRVDAVENKLILQEGEKSGKKSTGSTINTWVGFAFMIGLGLLTIISFFDKMAGGTP